MLLIAVIIILMPYYNEYVLGIKPPEEAPAAKTEQHVPTPPADIKSDIPNRINKTIASEAGAIKKEDIVIPDSLEKTVTVETGKYIAQFTNIGGGGLKQFILKNYARFDSSQVNLISEELHNNLTLSFQHKDGSMVETKGFIFNSDKSFKNITLSEGEQHTFRFEYIYNNESIIKEITFYGNSYHFDIDINFSSTEFMLNKQYQVSWVNGLPFTEYNKLDESQYAQASAYMADDIEHFEIDDAEKVDESYNGKADWIAVRNKYFMSSISVIDAMVDDGIYFVGNGYEVDDYIRKIYNTGYFARYIDSNKDRYRIYIGPLDYNELGKYDNNLDEIILNNGAYESFFRPITIHLILPFLEFLNRFISNWGLVIVLFSILIKIILYPLTKKSYKSQKKMQLIQPKMQAIREKYKNDPQRLNKEMMELYKVHGSPLSGCMPLLLQMPLLMALYIVFRSTIQLRGASFIPGWIDDLSRADTLFYLPFSIPMYGNEFNLLPIIMAVSMFFQSKMTITDPKQKQIMLIMPIMMLLFFNRFPSGLTLYYTLFNVLTILQQRLIKPNDDPPSAKVSVKTHSKKRKK